MSTNRWFKNQTFVHEGIMYIASRNDDGTYQITCDGELVAHGTSMHHVFEDALSDHDRIRSLYRVNCDEVLGSTDSAWDRLMTAVGNLRGDIVEKAAPKDLYLLDEDEIGYWTFLDQLNEDDEEQS